MFQACVYKHDYTIDKKKQVKERQKKGVFEYGSITNNRKCITDCSRIRKHNLRRKTISNNPS